jgi:hypothetical protein
MNYDTIGIESQIVEYPITNLPSIASNLFKFDGDNKYYTLLDNSFDINRVNILNPLLKDDEIFGVENNAIFTYIIGTQFNILNNNLVRDSSPIQNQVCDLNKLHIWAKRAISIQEINTKHSHILRDSYLNYMNIQNTIQENKQIDDIIKHTGIIDRIYFAGELKIQNNKVDINFLSGTYMEDLPCDNPPEKSVRCVSSFLKNLNNDIEVNVDTSCETYMNSEIKMTKELLNDYALHTGLKIYMFETESDAKNFSKKPLELEKLKSRIYIENRILQKNPNNEQIQNRIKTLEEQYEKLLNNNFGMKEYKIGGKKQKNKKKIIKKTKKYRKNKKSNKKSNKRKTSKK